MGLQLTQHATLPVSATPAWQSGRPGPLGAHWDGEGVLFSVFSDSANAIELCLYDQGGLHEQGRLPLFGPCDGVWHGYLKDAAPGLVYGLRAHGPWEPALGHRFNPHKLLLDPYAREIIGRFDWRDAHFGFAHGQPLQMDTQDNGSAALKARVVSDAFDWGDDKPPAIAAQDTVLYELHVRGFSRLHPAIPARQRGSYAALAHPESIAHLRALGVNAVSLLPIHCALDEQRLAAQGKRNYWGYNTLAFFCAEPRLACGEGGLSPRDEFRAMVRALHRAGIEVILDVVFNHTAETDEMGPTISLRGLDNTGYYRLRQDDRSLYENFSGCGNTLDMRRPQVLRLVMDSLRYWVSDMHVDGFRFDLAPVLGRSRHGFERDGPFFMALAQDPVLQRVKLIAEPWDLGPDGYQSGRFPRGWMEWNDKFRDDMRRFWLGWQAEPGNGNGPGLRGAFARRLCGSNDMFHAHGRQPAASVNYVASHDGFTLQDLVSYNQRHNLANGEDNRDGHGDNLSYNCGFEGPTDDPGILTLRGKLQRALLACTVLSQGTPMLCAGSELGQTQGGNNNPYNQDNATTWLDWSAADHELLAYTRHLLQLRHAMQPFRPSWYSEARNAHGLPDLSWLQANGSSLQGDAWHAPDRTLACLVGQPGRARSPLLLLVNAGTTSADFRLPPGNWIRLLDTAHARGLGAWNGPGETALPVAAHSLQLLSAQERGASDAVDQAQ